MEEAEALTPPELRRIAESVRLESVPMKSREIYLKHYLDFRKYLKDHNTETISENTLLAYMRHLLETKIVSTCWTIYSCLKKMIRVNDGINISQWPMVTDVLKTKAATHLKKKAKIFKREEVDRFLKDAPNDQYLEDKLALLLGLHGGLRTEEYLILNIEDIEMRQDYLKVTVRQRKTDQAGNGSAFIAVKNEAEHQCPLYYFQQYLIGRNQLSSEGRLFMQKRKGKFTNQVQ
ncbi:MAG TPA: tyrosine-type recombinase/integrase [Chitinophagaceae bacterium]